MTTEVCPECRLGGMMHNLEWIPLGPKLPLIIKQQAITGALLARHWGVCLCVWRRPNIWFGSWQAHRYKANIVMTDVWWRGSGLWKIHLSSQLKLSGGREERDMGAGRLPPVRPTLRSMRSVCAFGCLQEWKRESEQVCVRQLNAGQMKPGSCFGSSFLPKCPYPPTLLPSPISFLRRIPHPTPFCHTVKNLFPEAEATLMWEAQQKQSETQTLLRHTHTYQCRHTHKLALKRRHTLWVVSYLTWRQGMHVLYFPPWSNTVSPSSTR